MTFLRVCVTLCSLLALGKALPVNSTSKDHKGRCQFLRETDQRGTEAFTPECDSEGNFLPKQCCGSTGYCWCVNIFTGEEIVNTRGVRDDYRYDCGKDHYCPYDWCQHGSQCFKFMDSPKTWLEAYMFCRFEGSNLASVHSYEEYHTIQSLSRGNTLEFPLTWIGGHDALKDGHWMWIDGTKFDYEYWHIDDRIDGAEHCLLINYEYEWKWHKASCNQRLPFVCSMSYYPYR